MIVIHLECAYFLMPKTILRSISVENVMSSCVENKKFVLMTDLRFAKTATDCNETNKAMQRATGLPLK